MRESSQWNSTISPSNSRTFSQDGYTVPQRSHYPNEEWEGQHSHRFPKTKSIRPKYDLISNSTFLTSRLRYARSDTCPWQNTHINLTASKMHRPNTHKAKHHSFNR